MAGIKDVAVRAGVSISTVSYVMSGKRSVRNETKIKVMQAARELNYFPNAGARMLRGERTRLVALSSPMSDETAYGDWSPFFFGVARRLRHYGYDVLLLMGEDENEDLVRMSDSGLVDGIPLLDVAMSDPRARAAKTSRVPVASIGCPDDLDGVYAVDLDFEQMGEMAVQKLMKAGHRHVLFLGANSHAYEQGVNFLIRTRDSVRICAEKAGMRLTCDVIDTGDADEMECVVERAFASDPRITAVLGQVGLIAMSNLKSALQSRGYDIPKDISVLKQMQDKAREETGSDDVYALSLFKDWDDQAMQNGFQLPAFYGYAEGTGYVMSNADGTDAQSLIDENGVYVRALKFYNKAEQMGLVDPESTTQNYDTMYSKYKEGKILFSFWPWLGQAAYNTDAHKKDGKGFMMLSIDDMKIASKGAQPNGTTTFIGVGEKAKNKERLVKFIDWLYSPEGIQAAGSQTNGAAGLKGLTWDIKDGKPVLTDFGVKAMGGESVNVPEEYGGGGYSDGASQLNVSTVLNKDIDPRTNAPYNYQMWDSELAKRDTALDKDWQEHMGGARTTMEYLEQSGKLAVIPGASYTTPDEDSVISTTRGQLKTAVVNACWQAVFSKSDDELNSIWSKMQKEVDGLGYKKVYDVDMKNTKDMFKARQAIEKEYASREK